MPSASNIRISVIDPHVSAIERLVENPNEESTIGHIKWRIAQIREEIETVRNRQRAMAEDFRRTDD